MVCYIIFDVKQTYHKATHVNIKCIINIYYVHCTRVIIFKRFQNSSLYAKVKPQ